MAPETCQDTFVESIRQAAAARDADALHKLYDQTDIREYAKASDERLDARFINEPTCANIQHTVQEIKTLWKSLDEVESAERTEQQQRQAENLLNGAQAQILSRNRSQVIAGMETVKTYLLDTERAFVGRVLPPALRRAEASRMCSKHVTRFRISSGPLTGNLIALTGPSRRPQAPLMHG
ncbi:hypothetical protein HED49_22910 [Ochrobactrum daejeonense]|nr:hypothetical protein [Brucella daejeonensis]